MRQLKAGISGQEATQNWEGACVTFIVFQRNPDKKCADLVNKPIALRKHLATCHQFLLPRETDLQNIVIQLNSQRLCRFCSVNIALLNKGYY